MAKTLKQFKQGYTPRSADEKKFVDKHTVQKTPDANGNGDDVFNAKNVKMFDRELEHGYNPGSDEEVYEQKMIPVPDDGSTADPGVDPKTGRRPVITYGPNKGKEWTKEAPGPTNPNFKPFVPEKEFMKGIQDTHKAASQKQTKQPVVEKKLTPAEMKKREEVARAIERENPNMPMAKKMAIATATAKKVAEETSSVEEGLMGVIGKRAMAVGKELGKRTLKNFVSELVPGGIPALAAKPPQAPDKKNKKVRPSEPAPEPAPVKESNKTPFEGPYTKPDAHGSKSRAKHLAKMAMKRMMDKAVEDAAAAGSKKKVNETELKDYLVSLYANKLSEEDNQALQEMLETEEGTKVAFMISMLIEDETMLDEVMKKSEKYSHRSFLNKLKQNNTGA